MMMPHGLFARMRSGEKSSAEVDDGNAVMVRIMAKRADVVVVMVRKGFIILERMFLSVFCLETFGEPELMYYERAKDGVDGNGRLMLIVIL
mmetsp:Transcript_18336/g.29693  ORF Transcript_18336/g.29693 Transcript_18336/m.29693 type:complete len:91 (+) Transcript_18336:617-889(+)